jgi:metal-responsive CopG/Arc/MetJ family transcriptional regulator
MKTAVSIPDPIFEAADQVANRLGISRSQLYAQAVEEFIKARGRSWITESLNAVYDEEDSSVDPVLMKLQLETLEAEDW